MKGHYTIWALLLVLCGLLPLYTQGGQQMPKLSDKKLCADAECSHPILIAKAIQDYYPQDCRFIPIHQGQLVYVYSMLKDRGNLFWTGSVQGSYYGDQEARLGHFPSSVVEETHALMPAEVEVKTNFSHYYDTTYSSSYNKEEKSPVYRSFKKEPRSFPGHQPELDPPHTKRVPNSCYRLDFGGRHSSGQTKVIQENISRELDSCIASKNCSTASQ